MSSAGRKVWFGVACGLSLFAASGCGSQGVMSPIMTLQEIPHPRVLMRADRGFSPDPGLTVIVTILYDTGGPDQEKCGTLRSPSATLGGVQLALSSAGMRIVDYEQKIVCIRPQFHMQFGSDAPSGPLEITDGVTTARAEYDALDPGTATLVVPVDGTLHPGDSVRWRLNLPANIGVSGYRLTSNAGDWAQGTATPAGGDFVAPIPASYPSNYSGSVELALTWTLDVHVTSCSAGFACAVLSDALTGFTLTIRP